MTPSGRMSPTSPSTSPHRGFSVMVRFVLAMAGLAALTVPYFLACVVLLPSRILRLRLGNAVGSAAGRWVNAVAGLSYEVIGPSPDSLAPALFLQNHTGTLDLFLAMQLCPSPGSGTVKKELLRVPFIGLGYSLSGHLVLDRQDQGRSIHRMDAIAELVKSSGISIWILPEGTRSRDGRLQPFKKGFAHLALTTRLPIVPIVVHDGHRFWPSGLKVRPGCVRVEVLPPIPTTGWTHDCLSEKVAELESKFASALAEHQRPMPER